MPFHAAVSRSSYCRFSLIEVGYECKYDSSWSFTSIQRICTKKIRISAWTPCRAVTPPVSMLLQYSQPSTIICWFQDPSHQKQLNGLPDSRIWCVGSQGTRDCHTAQQSEHLASDEGLTHRRAFLRNIFSSAVSLSHVSSLAGVVPATQGKKEVCLQQGLNAAIVCTTDGREN